MPQPPNDPARIRLTSLSHGGGCAASWHRLCSNRSSLAGGHPIPRELLVGIETSDDAAVPDQRGSLTVATTDFHADRRRPVRLRRNRRERDPDIRAMGGRLFALALVAMPIATLPLETIGNSRGGESVAVGRYPVAGGQRRLVEPIYGLVAIGLVNPRHVKRNAKRSPATRLSSARLASASTAPRSRKRRSRA